MCDQYESEDPVPDTQTPPWQGHSTGEGIVACVGCLLFLGLAWASGIGLALAIARLLWG